MGGRRTPSVSAACAAATRTTAFVAASTSSGSCSAQPGVGGVEPAVLARCRDDLCLGIEHDGTNARRSHVNAEEVGRFGCGHGRQV